MTFVQSDWPLNIIYISERKHILVLMAKDWIGMYLCKNSSNTKQSKGTLKSYILERSDFQRSSNAFQVSLWCLFLALISLNKNMNNYNNLSTWFFQHIFLKV